jgi:cytochrome c oxidase subunit 2
MRRARNLKRSARDAADSSLSGLLIYGPALLSDLLAQPSAGSLKIFVTGEQYWWRVRYGLPDGATIELANEIRLPVGESVEFQLEGNDVIHSFWIPSLAGKVDMIPGRVTRLTLLPAQTGTFRGVCAEYCGTAHALMAFPVVVLEKDEFARWLAGQREPAAAPGAATVSRGQQLFLANGCGARHTIRGSQAAGVIGPDLTHAGSRLTLGAGILPNEPEVFRQWIARPGKLKPGVLMPAFGRLPEDDLRARAVYLEELR